MSKFQSIPSNYVQRRQFLTQGATASAAFALSAATFASTAQASSERAFKLNYMVASCMYGYLYIGEILPELKKTGSSTLDLWPKVHGNQREQLQDMGEELFMQLLEKHDVSVGCLTQYPLGPFGLEKEFSVASRLGCTTMVTGGKGPVGLKGPELKAAVRNFTEAMKPHVEKAAEAGITIAIENHANNLIDSPDSVRWLAELSGDNGVGIALAPYHLPQDPQDIAALIRECGPSIKVFYAWQHGMGCHKRLPKEQELLQMPGRGDLDFEPILKALAEIKYEGWTEIFMHPVPRGIPILETAAEVTAEINRSRDYLEKLIRNV